MIVVQVKVIFFYLFIFIFYVINGRKKILKGVNFFYIGDVVSSRSSRWRQCKKPVNKRKKVGKGVSQKARKIKKKPKPLKSTREHYGDNVEMFIMDARTNANIGRYINHSCSPNLFVQNVFVDTHDIRFPWISFFALHFIKAGTELTWDYNYVIGGVPGKEIMCHCNSANCRKRLL